LANRGGEFRVGTIAIFDQQRFLGGEMQKERRPRDVSSVADVLNRNRIETSLEEQVHRGVVDIRAGAPLLALAARDRRRFWIENRRVAVLGHKTRLKSIK